jgi:hypothetical protein
MYCYSVYWESDLLNNGHHPVQQWIIFLSPKLLDSAPGAGVFIIEEQLVGPEFRPFFMHGFMYTPAYFCILSL